MKEFKFNENFAKELIEERNKNGNFENISDISIRMKKYYLRKGYSENDSKITYLASEVKTLRITLMTNSNLEIKNL